MNFRYQCESVLLSRLDVIVVPASLDGKNTKVQTHNENAIGNGERRSNMIVVPFSSDGKNTKILRDTMGKGEIRLNVIVVPPSSDGKNTKIQKY